MRKLIIVVALLILGGATRAQAQPPGPLEIEWGKFLAWDYSPMVITAAGVVRFEVKFDASPVIVVTDMVGVTSTDPALREFKVALPGLTPGDHTAIVRACNTSQCGAWSSSLAFTLVVIPAPIGVRIK